MAKLDQVVDKFTERCVNSKVSTCIEKCISEFDPLCSKELPSHYVLFD